MKHYKNAAKIVLSVGMLALFTWLLVRGIDFKLLSMSFYQANWLMVGIAFIFLPLSLIARALRWRYLLCAYGNVSFKNVFEVTCVTRTLASVLPFRAADFLQGVLLGKKEKIHTIGVLASVLAERMIDLLFLVIFFAILSYFVLIPSDMKQYVYILVAAIFAGFFVVVYNFKIIEKFARKVSPFIADKLLHFEPGLMAFRNLKMMMVVSILTVVGLLLQIIFSGMVLVAFGVPFSGSLFIAYQVVPAFACIVPSTPGFIGVWDYFAVSTLTLFGVEKSLALGATAFIHFYSLVGTSIFGLFYMGKSWFFTKTRIEHGSK
jgi:uncharacterized protein (TIRG00374 family)